MLCYWYLYCIHELAKREQYHKDILWWLYISSKSLTYPAREYTKVRILFAKLVYVFVLSTMTTFFVCLIKSPYFDICIAMGMPKKPTTTYHKKNSYEKKVTLKFFFSQSILLWHFYNVLVCKLHNAFHKPLPLL